MICPVCETGRITITKLRTDTYVPICSNDECFVGKAYISQESVVIVLESATKEKEEC
jgi:hypothetical protein